MSKEQLAASIIKDIIYIVLGTVSPDSEPLVTPVYAAYDEELNFYWGSPQTTHHSQYLKKNNKIGFVIFDSKATLGTGEGVYGSGTAEELTKEAEIENALKYTYGRGGDKPDPAKLFMGNGPVRMWKLSTKRIWMSDADKKGNIWVDKRVQIDRKKVIDILFN